MPLLPRIVTAVPLVLREIGQPAEQAAFRQPAKTSAQAVSGDGAARPRESGL
jgi:hypothetical protein